MWYTSDRFTRFFSVTTVSPPVPSSLPTRCPFPLSPSPSNHRLKNPFFLDASCGLTAPEGGATPHAVAQSSAVSVVRSSTVFAP